MLLLSKHQNLNFKVQFNLSIQFKSFYYFNNILFYEATC